MRYRFALAALMLPLAGCVVAPPPPVAYGGPPPGYGGPPPDFAYPGYAYNDGSPTLVVEGVTWPLIYYGGGWGYWDGYHRWHGAPGGIGRFLESRHPGGRGYRPFGGGQFGRPVGFRGGAGFYGPRGGAMRAGGAAGFRPAGGTRAAAPQRHREEGHH